MNRFLVGSIFAYIIIWLLSASFIGMALFLTWGHPENILVVIPALLYSPFVLFVIVIGAPMILVMGVASALIHVASLQWIQKRTELRPRIISMLIGCVIGTIQLVLSASMWNSGNHSLNESTLPMGIGLLGGCLCSSFIIGGAYEESD